MVYARQDLGVVLVDMHDTSLTTPMDPWLGRVYLLANGTHTVQELIDFVGRQYGGSPPPNLGATIDSVIDRLHETKTIAFSDEPISLPYYLRMEAEQQDPQLTNRLMAEDGYQQGKLPEPSSG